MPTQDDIEGQKQLLNAHRATLAHYLIQRAGLGLTYAPPGVSNGIAGVRVEIRRCKAILSSWGAPVEDHPDDEDPPYDPAPVPVQATPMPTTVRVTLLIEGDVLKFTPEQQAGFMFLLARVVNVSNDQIRVVYIGPGGSIKLILTMPADAVQRLAALYAAADPSLQPLHLLNIVLQADEVRQVVGSAQETYRRWTTETEPEVAGKLQSQYQADLEQLWDILADDLRRIAGVRSPRRSASDVDSLAQNMFKSIVGALPEVQLDQHHDLHHFLLTVAERGMSHKYRRSYAVNSRRQPASGIAVPPDARTDVGDTTSTDSKVQARQPIKGDSVLHSNLYQLPLAQIERRCREETDKHRKGRPSDEQFCLEIFRRAIASTHSREQVASDSTSPHGDDMVREVLYHIYTPFIEAHINRSRLLALGISRDDIVQDAWLSFWRAAQKDLDFPSLPKALGYLRLTVQTAVLQALRRERERVKEVILDDSQIGWNVSDSTADPFLQTHRRTFLERVQKVLGAAALEYRIFWLRYQLGIPPREIAPMLAREGIVINGRPPTPGSVSQLLDQSMRRLADDSIIRDLLKSD